MPKRSNGSRINSSTMFAECLPPNEKGCRIWMRSCSSGGYGHVWVDGKLVLAHRHAWELVNGPLPLDCEDARHTCDTPACINPDHVLARRLKTSMTSRMDHNKFKTHCPQGHPLDGRRRQGDRVMRYCLTCKAYA